MPTQIGCTISTADVLYITGNFTLHNHPSGDLEPSRNDLQVTEQLRAAGEIVGIKLIDHIIVSNDGGFLSVKERGIL
jgi:DNA repair protein RadC